MEIISSPTGAPSLPSALVSLGQIFPLINGKASGTQPGRRWQVGHRLYYEYAINQPECALFLLEIEQINTSECALRYSVSGGAAGSALNSFGIRFQQVNNLRQYLRHGYHSWDGSYFVDPEALAGWGTEETRPETGYAMTLLMPRNAPGSLVIGFERHDRFQQTFTFDTRNNPPSLAVETLWDGKHRTESMRCESERLLIFEHPQVEGALREWARRVAAASPLALRQSEPITGWCSWYNLYNHATEENILQHLQGVREVSRRNNLPLQVFQIDDSFTPEMGDWLEVKPQFPRGMKPLLDDIRAACFTPGLWIAPFLIGNRSHLFRDHPDWVLRERDSGEPLAHMKLYGEFRWGKRTSLKTDHPLAKAVFLALGQRWPEALYFDDVLAAATRLVGFGSAEDAATLERILLAGFGLRMVDASIEPWLAVSAPSASPRASALARLDAESSNIVTSLMQRRVGVEEPLILILLRLCDGSRDRQALLAELCRHDPNVNDDAVQQHLAWLALVGLMEA